MQSNDIQEVESIMNNIAWVKQNIPTAIANWKSKKPNCD